MGRRHALILSSMITAVAFIALGILIHQMENATDTAIGINQILAVMMLYLFAIGFEIGWGPVVWVICSEIYPNNIRAVCISLTTTISFVTNAVISKVCHTHIKMSLSPLLIYAYHAAHSLNAGSNWMANRNGIWQPCARYWHICLPFLTRNSWPNLGAYDRGTYKMIDWGGVMVIYFSCLATDFLA